MATNNQEDVGAQGEALWHLANRMRARIAEASRIVVKLGTHVVTRDGVEFALGRVTQIVEHLVDRGAPPTGRGDLMDLRWEGKRRPMEDRAHHAA